MQQINTDQIRLHDDGSSPERVKLRAEIPNHTPSSLWWLWTTAEGIQKWWGPEDVILDLSLGGKYRFKWSSWIIVGAYTIIDEARELAFTWYWEGEPMPERHVRITFTPDDKGGTVLTVEHGTYAAGDEIDRQSHIDGWMHFLPILAGQNAN